MIEIIPNWHPILVHFTIGLLGGSVVLFIAGTFARQRASAAGLLTAAYWNLWLGAGITFVTVAAGYNAFDTVAHDQPSHTAMIEHQYWALATAALFWSLALWSTWGQRRGRRPSASFLSALVLATALLIITGFKGGELVYRHGLGVMSLPQGVIPSASGTPVATSPPTENDPVSNDQTKDEQIADDPDDSGVDDSGIIGNQPGAPPPGHGGHDHMH